MSTVEKKIYGSYVAMVSAIVSEFKVQYDEKRVNDVCEQLAVMSEKLLREQEEASYYECTSDIEDYGKREQKLKQVIEEKVGNKRGTGIDNYKVEITGDVLSTINNNIDAIFVCEQKVRGIMCGDVSFDMAIEFYDLEDKLYDALTSVSND